MNALVDTSVWSLALRRESANLNERERKVVEELARLALAGQVRLMGPIRQELLSGIREAGVFERLRNELGNHPTLAIESADYDSAAGMYNVCRAHGVTPSSVDVLICAVAVRAGMAIFTVDSDFQPYAQWLPLKLHHLP